MQELNLRVGITKTPKTRPQMLVVLISFKKFLMSEIEEPSALTVDTFPVIGETSLK